MKTHTQDTMPRSEEKLFARNYRPNSYEDQGSLSPVDFPLSPDQCILCRRILHHREVSAGNAGVAAVGIPGAPFCQQMRKKLFTKTVTRLPNGIAFLTCEWRALQQLAHQNPLDLTRVAITWHIKSIPAPILTPPHPPFLSLQSWQTFYAHSHVQMCQY